MSAQMNVFMLIIERIFLEAHYLTIFNKQLFFRRKLYLKKRRKDKSYSYQNNSWKT